ncbi:peptidylprolyl isomerase [Aneurinibacillus sp. Ricciae_BoGa-3]|uniref:peptidylprolyl isomerase n=1 Tax=Aneurinibacillus sp. Ricciae_BoGa-3 TaxID=3022697 RepID=UPI00233FA8C6|nr:peptidylprolyl isomerase [Aneurinibacillus sp. Ricciae_BoGa-3]WCK56026.1 peptidylprolyl isomerase [Aneurinibacillus sp. Ricciae_BoGa-3]
MKKRIVASAIALLLPLFAAACSPGNMNANSGSGQSANNQNAANNQGTGKSSSPTPAVKQWSKPPAMQIDVNKQYMAHVDTNKGSFTIDLFAKDAPKTVNNFVFLANQHFYDGIDFHRIMKTFMIQVGDPFARGDVANLKSNPRIGSGGPGYTFEDELSSKYKYAKGMVAMANAGPNTNGSQFFIGSGKDVENLAAQPNYTIFGKVVQGMDTIDKIANTPVTQGVSDQSDPSFPTQNVYIKSIKIEQK